MISSVILITSCGYISDKPVENADIYKTDELQSCKIDVSKLSEIFTLDQKSQILCLQENFVQFTKYVRSKNPGSITEAELGLFVKRFFEGQSDSIVKGLSLIFQLNMILLKDEADRISNSKISPLFELLVRVNQEAVVISNIIKTMDNQKNQHYFWDMKKQFNESTSRFSQTTIAIINANNGSEQKLNIKDFVLSLNTKLSNGKIDQKDVDAFIFLKKLLIGGDEETITSTELKNIIAKLPSILNLIFDTYYVKAENFKSEAEETRFYLTSVQNLTQLIVFNQPNFELVNTDEIVHIAEKFLKNYDVETFKPSIEALKLRFIGGIANSFTLFDFQNILTIVQDYFEKIYYNHITYDDPVNNYILSQKRPLTSRELPFKTLPGHEIFSGKKRIEQLQSSFIDTVTVFRYFRNPVTGSAKYDGSIERNKKGFIETNIAKWLSWKLLKAYGHLDPAGQMQISINEFSKFLLDAKPILVELKLWSPNFQTFSRNAVLLADLFQQQSNGDQLININEATEYIGMILTAVELSNRYSKNLIKVCDSGFNTSDPIFDKSCFNQHFFESILTQLDYKQDLPRLFKYYSSVNFDEYTGYLLGVQGFARDDDNEGVPVNSRDTTLILGAMLNIESTFIRFDKNSDNIIDYDELSEAFLVYKSSIIALANLKPGQEKYAKGIFLYMVSKMKIPKSDSGKWLDDLEFPAFNSCSQSKWCRDTLMVKIEAKRLNIGKLLYYLVVTPTPAK